MTESEGFILTTSNPTSSDPLAFELEALMGQIKPGTCTTFQSYACWKRAVPQAQRVAAEIAEAFLVVRTASGIQTRAAGTVGGVEAEYALARNRAWTAYEREQSRLLRTARIARDSLAQSVGRRVATVTAGYHPASGRIFVGCSMKGKCAEDVVADQFAAIGVERSQIRFTEAVRPRYLQTRPDPTRPICIRCQGTYARSQFPQGTVWDRPGPWGE